MLLDPSGFSSEDITSPFNIPRTSSIAKAKRPSVSFAEGTRFSPKERRGSGQDVSAPSGHPRKPKSAWGGLMLSALQSQGGDARPGEEDGGASEEREDAVDVQDAGKQEVSYESADQEVEADASMSERRRTMSNTAGHRGTHTAAAEGDTPGGVSHKVTTVYVTVGRAGGPVTKAESNSEGPVQAMLRRLGSLKRQSEQEPGRLKLKGAEGLGKPPRKKLGARASVWDQGGPSGGEAGVCKPIRRKHACPNSTDAGANDTAPLEGGPAKRPLSFTLNSVPEASADSRSELRAEAEPGEEPSMGQTESNYLTVGPAGDAASVTEVIANEGAVVGGNEEPCYENVMIMHS